MPDVKLDIAIPGTELFISGTYREVQDAPLVIFVHGFTGFSDEPQFYNCARYLEAAGFSSYRFDLYGSKPEQRSAMQCSVQDHVADLDLVVKTFRQSAPDLKVGVVGHSLGGITVLCSKDVAFDAAVLWDPAHPDNADGENQEWIEALECWRVPSHVEMLVGDPLFKSWENAPVDAAAKAFDVPTRVIGAGGGILQSVGRKYAEAIPAESDYIEVPEAGHSFRNADTDLALFGLTIDWFEKHGR